MKKNPEYGRFGVHTRETAMHLTRPVQDIIPPKGFPYKWMGKISLIAKDAKKKQEE